MTYNLPVPSVLFNFPLYDDPQENYRNNLVRKTLLDETKTKDENVLFYVTSYVTLYLE